MQGAELASDRDDDDEFAVVPVEASDAELFVGRYQDGGRDDVDGFVLIGFWRLLNGEREPDLVAWPLAHGGDEQGVLGRQDDAGLFAEWGGDILAAHLPVCVGFDVHD